MIVALPYTLTHTRSLSETHRKRITWSVTNFIGLAALSCYKHCSLMLMNLYSQSPDFLAIKRKKKFEITLESQSDDSLKLILPKLASCEG